MSADEKKGTPSSEPTAPGADPLRIWSAVRTPPPEALRAIEGGRLSGKTTVNPMWRFEAVTSVFGPCGIGWKYENVSFETVFGPDAVGEVVLFCRLDFRYSVAAKNPIGLSVEGWSDPIPGVGGAKLVSRESSGPYFDEDAWKKAMTDALSVALRALGVAADVYLGRLDSRGGGARSETRSSGPRQEVPPEKKAGLKWIEEKLASYFPGENENGKVVPWFPKAKCAALKDAFGSGSWKDGVLPLDVGTLRAAAANVEGTGLSRFEMVCRLVVGIDGEAVRRPDDVAPKDWPSSEVWNRFSDPA